MIEGFSDLSDDKYVAFIQLHSEFESEFNSLMGDSNSNFEYCASNYTNKTIAASQALDIDAFLTFRVEFENSREFSAEFSAFKRAVEGLIIQIRVRYSRQIKERSVGLSDEQKSKIHSLINKIREQVGKSSASTDKKERIFTIIAKLSEEIDKPRAGLERFGDFARGLAGVSKDVADGAEPWWKWFKVIMGVVDEAKSSEPQLPPPSDIKKIEPPRKIERGSRFADDLDDEIPF
ncbi:MAG: hypothetical protein ACFBWO_07185 [Paracoccaceae bacterium]